MTGDARLRARDLMVRVDDREGRVDSVGVCWSISVGTRVAEK
jgi:hypothetical protein